MNRDDFKLLADARIADAQILLGAQRWPAAYYLSGYAVECALKARVCRQFLEHDVPDKKLVNAFYTHDLVILLSLSGAKQDKEDRCSRDIAFEINWNTVKDWDEESRYDCSTTETKARDMLAAVSDTGTGILPWLKTLW